MKEVEKRKLLCINCDSSMLARALWFVGPLTSFLELPQHSLNCLVNNASTVTVSFLYKTQFTSGILFNHNHYHQPKMLSFPAFYCLLISILGFISVIMLPWEDMKPYLVVYLTIIVPMLFVVIWIDLFGL